MTDNTPRSPDAANATVTPALFGADVREGGRGSLITTVGSTHHMNVDVKGVLLRWSPTNFRKHWRGFFRHDDGRNMTEQEAHGALLDELAQGHEHIPVGGPCEGFDYKRGCPGHRMEKPA